MGVRVGHSVGVALFLESCLAPFTCTLEWSLTSVLVDWFRRDLTCARDSRVPRRPERGRRVGGLVLLLLLLLLLLLQSLSFSSSFHHFYLLQTSKPIHFLKAYEKSYSNTNSEHKYKDKYEYKDNDKDKDTERTTESLSVCYIFGIGTTRAFQV